MSSLLSLSRKLRRDQTEAEKIFWSKVRAKRFYNLKFRRQESVAGYIVDFVCIERRLIVEIDGGQHNKQVDDDKESALKNAGFVVKRYWNNEVLRNMEGILEDLKIYLDHYNPSPNPLPKGEGSHG